MLTGIFLTIINMDNLSKVIDFQSKKKISDVYRKVQIRISHFTI